MYIIGIDIGGSTTKICGFKVNDKTLIKPFFIKASDQVSSLYGAFGKFTSDNNIDLSEIKKIHITGVGSSFIEKDLYGIPTYHVEETKAIGKGGLYLSVLNEAVVVSMGTGTSIVMAKNNADAIRLGGTGVGGGTLQGLSKMLLNVTGTDNIIALAEDGDLKNIDLRLGDITKKDIIPGMPDHMTVSNFGKINDLATKSDIALGIVNMVFETIGMMSIFAARQFALKDIVLIGNTYAPQSVGIFNNLNEMFGVNFQIPEYSRFGTVIGAALCADEIDNI